MKVLLDSCVSGKAADAVRAAGHDVVWAGNWPCDPGDAQILQSARADARILVTIDKDFGELVVVQGIAHAGLIRLSGFRAANQGAAINRLLATYGAELVLGAMVTAEPWRARIRPG